MSNPLLHFDPGADGLERRSRRARVAAATAEYIGAHPEEFTMTQYFLPEHGRVTLAEFAAKVGPDGCRTACCIAGTAVHVAAALGYLGGEFSHTSMVPELAGDLLGLSKYGRRELFMAIDIDDQQARLVLEELAKELAELPPTRDWLDDDLVEGLVADALEASRESWGRG